jgi:hypothetical protein
LKDKLNYRILLLEQTAEVFGWRKYVIGEGKDVRCDLDKMHEDHLDVSGCNVVAALVALLELSSVWED